MKKTPQLAPLLFHICTVFAIILLTYTMSYGQHSQAMHQVQQAYIQGEIGADEAITSQIEILQHDETGFVKCITPLIDIINENDALRNETITLIQQTFGAARSKAQASVQFVSPGSKFRIHYDTTGVHQVPPEDENLNSIPDYVEEVALAADSSYFFEINRLGFPDPVPTNTEYDVYLVEMTVYGGEIYGFTDRTNGPVGCNINAAATCIYVENDFRGFPENDDPDSDELGAMRVTVAHELKHAIQYIQNNWAGNSDNWAEMDATLMEEVVYDQVNDYYNYIDGFANDLFSYPSVTFDEGWYEHITWALYFHERFDEQFWTRVWERIEAERSLPFLEAVSEELRAMGESYQQALLEAYMWHFASGPVYASPNYGFPESADYPNPNLSEEFAELQISPIEPIFLNDLSARYYSINQANATKGLAKLNYTATSENLHFGLIGYFNDGNVLTDFVIGNALRSSGSIETAWPWQELATVGLVVSNSGTNTDASYSFQFTEYFIPTTLQLAQNYPNPFNAQTTIRITAPFSQQITLTVLDVLGRPIQTLFTGRIEGVVNIPFDASHLSSGLYFYKVEGENEVYVNKMLLIK